WQPGFRLPLHVHPNGHEVTFVVEGEQTFEIEGVGTKVVKAGEAIYTPPNTPHTSRNTGSTPSKTVVVRVKDADKPIMVEVKRWSSCFGPLIGGRESRVTPPSVTWMVHLGRRPQP